MAEGSMQMQMQVDSACV